MVGLRTRRRSHHVGVPVNSSDRRPPSAYIDFADLPHEYDALKARYDVLFREYLELSGRAALLERRLIRYLTGSWSAVTPEPQHTTTDPGESHEDTRQH